MLTRVQVAVLELLELVELVVQLVVQPVVNGKIPGPILTYALHC
jgi:hypothetical protein